MRRAWPSGDTLAVMERRGSITAEMRTAGEAFRDLADRDGLDGAEVAAILAAIGGRASPAGSIVLFVIGGRRSLKEWAATGWRGRPVGQEAGSGILVAALGALLVALASAGGQCESQAKKRA
jgi:hypothetical protein